MTSRRQKILIGLAIAFVAGLFVLGFFVGAAVYGFKAAQRAGNETATKAAEKTIAAIEMEYFNTHKRTFGTFDELIKEQLLSLKFSGNPVIADGYVLTLKLTGKTDPGSSYTLNGDPIDDDYSEKHFYLDSTSPAVHANPDNKAGPNDSLVPNR